MNNHQKLFLIIILVAVISLLYLSSMIEADIVFGQPMKKLVKPSVSVKTTNTEKTTSTMFSSAASANADLKTSLRWTFGKKQQTGWYLYLSQIQHTIKSEAAPDSKEFASALSVWQKENLILPTGILDRETLSELIKFWQSRRLPKLFEADETTLFHAPIEDFYDPTREANLLYLDKETYTAYKKMIAAAAKDLNLKIENGILVGDDKFLTIISAYRSRAYQDQLRKKEPTAGRAQLALKSPHFTGRALDIYVGGEPVTTKDENRAIQVETEVYKWLVENAGKFGFYNYFYEPWHWEYVPENKQINSARSVEEVEKNLKITF